MASIARHLPGLKSPWEEPWRQRLIDRPGASAAAGSRASGWRGYTADDPSNACTRPSNLPRLSHVGTVVESCDRRARTEVRCCLSGLGWRELPDPGGFWMGPCRRLGVRQAGRGSPGGRVL